MNREALLATAEQHLTLIRPSSRAYADDVTQNRAQFNYRKNLLIGFVEFWSARGCPWPIKSLLAIEWVLQGTDRKKPIRDRHRLQTICKFLKHLRTIEAATEVPDHAFRKSPRRNPRLLSDQEVASLMEAAGRIRRCGAFRRLTVVTLYGLLASTGLRIGEAHRLKDEDALLHIEPPHLMIHESKFGKTRIVVLHPTVVKELRDYRKQRTVELGTRSAEMFFSNRKGTPLCYNCSDTTLRLLVRQLGIKSVAGERTASLHSFRHSFAVSRLTTWHRDGKNVQELLPHLSVYMGHLNPQDTYWYLSATAELMEAASSRFETNHQQGAARP